jgi:phosphomannomutase
MSPTVSAARLCSFSARKAVVVGHDIRLSSQALSAALVRGLREQGADVIDIGLCGTEEVYFATFHLGVDGGIAVTASHNPMDYNGMKFVREGSRPISGDTGLKDIQALAESGVFYCACTTGKLSSKRYASGLYRAFADIC